MTIPEPMMPSAPGTCPSCSAFVAPGATVCGKCGASLVEETDSAEAATLLAELTRALEGRYVVGEVLGSGRGGITVRAHHIASKKDVAVKVAWNDPVARTQVLRETVLTAKVVHPNVPTVRDIQAPEPMLVVEMPLVTGGTLNDLLATGKPVPYPRVLEIIRAIASALDQAHAAGIIHGGLRPVKILLDAAGQPIVSDFAIRVPRRADWDVAGPSEVGSWAYMPLEQRHDSPTIDGRIDQYALAILAYELLRGRPTWRINDEGVIEIDALEILVHRPIAPGAPLSASMAIKRATAKDPAFRYQSAGAFVRAFSGEAAEVVAKAQIYRDEVAVKGGRSWLWFGVPVALGLALLATRPGVRESAIDLWSRGLAGSKGARNSDPLFPSADAGSTTPSSSGTGRADASSAPSNTRVGDSSNTVRGSTKAGAGDALGPTQPASNTREAAPSPRETNTKLADATPPLISPATPASRSARDSIRRATVGGEITAPRQGSATSQRSATDNAANRPTDGVMVVTLEANSRAVVVVDGRPRGQTPLTVKLSPGLHVVSLRGATVGTGAARTISIAAGDTARVVFGRP
jgi:Protein kinase domain